MRHGLQLKRAKHARKSLRFRFVRSFGACKERVRSIVKWDGLKQIESSLTTCYIASRAHYRVGHMAQHTHSKLQIQTKIEGLERTKATARAKKQTLHSMLKVQQRPRRCVLQSIGSSKCALCNPFVQSLFQHLLGHGLGNVVAEARSM